MVCITFPWYVKHSHGTYNIPTARVTIPRYSYHFQGTHNIPTVSIIIAHCALTFPRSAHFFIVHIYGTVERHYIKLVCSGTDNETHIFMNIFSLTCVFSIYSPCSPNMCYAKCSIGAPWCSHRIQNVTNVCHNKYKNCSESWESSWRGCGRTQQSS